MAQTLINFRIDEVTKKQMEQICNENVQRKKNTI